MCPHEYQQKRWLALIKNYQLRQSISQYPVIRSAKQMSTDAKEIVNLTMHGQEALWLTK